MNYTAFKHEIAHGEPRPVYLFVGEEDFLAEEGVQAIIDRTLEPDQRMLNLTVLYGRDAEGWGEALSALPVFASRRVTVVRQAHELKTPNLEAVLRYLEDPPGDACLILWAGKVDKRRSFFKGITEKVDPVNCGRLRSGQLTTWMKDFVNKLGKTLDGKAVGRLMSVNWPNLRELAGELDRLTLMVGDKEVIGLQDIEMMGEVSFAFERWALTDAVGSGDIQAAQKAVGNLQFWNVKPTQTIGDLYRMFHKLWLINYHLRRRSSGLIKDEIDLHPFVLKKYIDYAQRISRKSLEDCILRILEADLNIKRGLCQAEIEINMLVLELVQAVSGGSR